MRILDADAVRAALPMAAAIDAVRWAYIAVSSGHAVMPKRIHLSPPDSNNVTLVMPAYVQASPDGKYPASLAVKTVSVYPGNRALGLASIVGGILVLNPETGECEGLVDGASLTALRTGAGSGAATDILARADAATVAIFGAGVQAEAQLEAVCAVRQIRTAWIFDRTPERANQMCSRLAGRNRTPTDLRVAHSPKEALADADIVCTATNSYDPLFADTDLKPGTHINAIGSFRPEMQEIPAASVQRARVYVDHLESALQEAGDLVQPIRSGVIDQKHIIGEIGMLFAGGLMGRQSQEEVTLFKSVGLAVQDAVCASLAIQRARENCIGSDM